ncbi:hypothetical protein [Actinoallomurus sp. NPDC052274]|uniref:DUF6907 domain-containing protein n=1 Tax=Actinoallomurus sp. NPDC052274 TaxID=3155420 RepID=UPI0034152A3C
MTITDVKIDTDRPLERIVDGATVAVAARPIPPAETAARPAWLPDGCPPWCDMGPLHKDSDHLDDRVHSGSATQITLTAEEPPLGPGVTPDGMGWTGESVSYPQPVQADIYLEQHYREATPRVWVGRDGRTTGMHLTLDEAEQFAHEVLKRVAIGRLTRPSSNSRAGCPSWCVDDHDSPLSHHEHISEIYGVALTAHPYTVSVASGQPETYHAPILAAINIDDDEPSYIAVIGHDDKSRSRLTAEEADQLANVLHTLAATVRTAQEIRPEAPPSSAE